MRWHLLHELRQVGQMQRLCHSATEIAGPLRLDPRQWGVMRRGIWRSSSPPQSVVEETAVTDEVEERGAQYMYAGTLLLLNQPQR